MSQQDFISQADFDMCPGDNLPATQAGTAGSDNAGEGHTLPSQSDANEPTLRWPRRQAIRNCASGSLCLPQAPSRQASLSTADSSKF